MGKTRRFALLRYSTPLIVRRICETHRHTYVQHRYIREDSASLSITRGTGSYGGKEGLWEAYCPSQDENPRGWIRPSELRGIVTRFARYQADVLGTQIKE